MMIEDFTKRFACLKIAANEFRLLQEGIHWF